PLVAGVLAWGRKLVLRDVVLGTIEVTCWKFGLTYLFAHTVWLFSTPPPKIAVRPAPLPDAPALVAKKALPEASGALEGAVVDATGRSVSGSILFVASGLEGYAFDATPPVAVPTLSIRSGAIEPRLAIGEL